MHDVDKDETLAMRPRIEIVDVAPRDGLQSDAVMFSTDQKLELIERIERAGVRRLEVASFVNPKRVPQMADADAVITGVRARNTTATHIGLVLNERGFDRAVALGVAEINVVIAVTDAFSRANQGVDTHAATAAAVAIAARARAHNISVSATLSTAFGCPFEGEVSVDAVLRVASVVADAGVDEIAFADTIGVAVPGAVRSLVDAARRSLPETMQLRAHFHNTRSTAVANVLAAVETGVTVIDASLGGVGGCPFAPRATGNVATEDVVYLLERSGYDTGVDLDLLIEASDWFARELGREVPSLVAKAGPFPRVTD